MANPAHKIAGPIIDKAITEAAAEHRKKIGSAMIRGQVFEDDVMTRSFKPLPVRQRIVAALSIATVNGRPVHPEVIAEWANEPARQQGMALLRIQRRGRALARFKAAVARKEARTRRYNLAKAKAQRAARKVHRAVQKIGTVASRIFSRHLRRAHDRSQ